jgi:uncharacterized protein
MVKKSIVKVIKKYLRVVADRGVPVKAGVLFGSYATGRTHKWSDIDLLVISPQFDKKPKRKHIDLLWRVAADVDSRIEPIAVGERQYEESDSSFIIEVARREGKFIPLAD